MCQINQGYGNWGALNFLVLIVLCLVFSFDRNIFTRLFGFG